MKQEDKKVAYHETFRIFEKMVFKFWNDKVGDDSSSDVFDYEELLLYWKIKPTQTSVSELKIADVQNPNIFICKSPEYDNTLFRYFKSLL